MMSFFRTYQKTFFIVITALVVISFFFVGPTAGGVRGKVTEHPLVQAIEGSTITKEQVEKMVEFISSNQADLLDDKVAFANGLNDGVLEKDFFETSLGVTLAEKIFPFIEPDLKDALQKAKSFIPYRHPRLASLSAKELWGQFSPSSGTIASYLMQAEGRPTLYTFQQMVELYKGHKSLPLVFCKRLMIFQERQEAQVEPDPELLYADMSLLGLHTALDWFGKTYVQAAAQVIMNGALQARQMGMKVSIQEAREQLLLHMQDAARRSGEKIEPSHLYATFLGQVRRLGMEERECLDLWQNVMLFRKWLASFSEGATIDPAILQAAEEAAKEEVVIDMFSLPSHLCCRDFLSMLKLQLYIEAVSPEGHNPLLFPEEIASLQQVAKKMPELIRKEYVLEHAEISVEKAALRIGMQQTWDWEVAQGWNVLAQAFPSFLSSSLTSKEERLACLDGLEEDNRLLIDEYARKKIFSSHPEMIREALSTAQTKKDTYLIGAKGEGLPYKHIKDTKQLYSYIEADCQEELSCYTEDAEHYYHITVVEKPASARLLTFLEADAMGILRQKLDAKLESLYVTARKKESSAYQEANGAWKPLTEVKERVGLLVFPGLVQSIQEEYKKVFAKELSLEQKQNPSFYVEYRMLAPIQKALQTCQLGQETTDMQQSPLLTQWKLEKVRQTKRKKDFASMAGEFALPSGAFSSIHLTGLGRGVFFQMIEKKEGAGLSQEEIKALRLPEEKALHKKKTREWVLALFEANAICMEPK